MLVGQQIGPFVIDRELGSGAMGAVYRGRYTKDGQVVAVKVMAPGLTATNRHAADRFEREAEILKQLRHPNIVRLFGVGKSQGVRYFAMEYVDGESLDKVMARRGRMSWEEVVDLGRQLCAALEHAHEKGIIHRDLKPSNLMILKDGTLKLTDFGIAKDMDVTQLTSANCTVGTAAYMSPEQCKGERVLTHKSDLYSLGVVFYELVTGRKPFIAENAMDMFVQHVQGAFPRPGQLVLDLPVWLDTLICQLLEKKPENRPLDANMVFNVLGSIREKVEAQRSAGVEAALSRVADRKPGQPRPDEADKEAARFLLRGKVRRVRKRKPLHRHKWLQAAGILALLAGMAGAVWLVFRPQSPDALYAEVERLMKSNDPEKQDLALDGPDGRGGPLVQYLRRVGTRLADDPRTRQVREWRDQVDIRQGEAKLLRSVEMKRKGRPYPPDSELGEETPFKAAAAEDAGDLDRARKQWEKAAGEGYARWELIAHKHLQELEAAAALEPKFEERYKYIRLQRREIPPDDKMEQQAFTAWRYGRFGDSQRARERFEELKSQTAAVPEQHAWYLYAAGKCNALKEKSKPDSGKEQTREELVKEQLVDARDKEKSDLDALRICHDIIALYGDDDEPALKKAVQEASKLKAKIEGKP
jgi:serine/threonine-protein kinase